MTNVLVAQSRASGSNRRAEGSRSSEDTTVICFNCKHGVRSTVSPWRCLKLDGWREAKLPRKCAVFNSLDGDGESNQ